MTYLHKIGLKYNTDKAYEHMFTKIYHKYFFKDRENIRHLLEIGIFGGSSLRMWSEYFPNAKIYGVDIENISIDWDRITTYQGDQSKRDDMERVAKLIKHKLDIIIDDGSHNMDDQQYSLGYLFKYVKPNGYYIIEDLHSSFDYQLERYHIKGDNKTYPFIINLKDNKKCKSNYISSEDSEYIEKHIESVEVYDMFGDLQHIICFIKKKGE